MNTGKLEATGTNGYHIKTMKSGKHAGETVVCRKNVVIRAGSLLSLIEQFKK